MMLGGRFQGGTSLVKEGTVFFKGSESGRMLSSEVDCDG